jgi:hypothetical protein
MPAPGSQRAVQQLYRVRPDVGIRDQRPGGCPNVNRIDLPQFYVVHVRILRAWTSGRKFYTYVGRDVSRRGHRLLLPILENILGTPFTHTGFLATAHVSPEWDVIAGIVVGSDVFKDNNSAPGFHGAFIWNSTDKRYNWTTAWITGPEQPDNNRDYRTLVSSYLTAKLDGDGRWLLSTGGHYGVEQNAATDPVTGGKKNADWYAVAANLFTRWTKSGVPDSEPSGSATTKAFTPPS